YALYLFSQDVRVGFGEKKSRAGETGARTGGSGRGGPASRAAAHRDRAAAPGPGQERKASASVGSGGRSGRKGGGATPGGRAEHQVGDQFGGGRGELQAGALVTGGDDQVRQAGRRPDVGAGVDAPRTEAGPGRLDRGATQDRADPQRLVEQLPGAQDRRA